jgi:hypothetical protein
MALQHGDESWEGTQEAGLASRRGRSILPRMGDLSRRAIRHVSRLSVDEQRDLLRDLTAPSIIRADAILQFRERPDGQGMAEVLMDLEADETLRLHVVDALRRSLASPGGTVALAEGRARGSDPALTRIRSRGPVRRRRRRDERPDAHRSRDLRSPCGGSGRRHGQRGSPWRFGPASALAWVEAGP